MKLLVESGGLVEGEGRWSGKFVKMLGFVCAKLRAMSCRTSRTPLSSALGLGILPNIEMSGEVFLMREVDAKGYLKRVQRAYFKNTEALYKGFQEKDISLDDYLALELELA